MATLANFTNQEIAQYERAALREIGALLRSLRLRMEAAGIECAVSLERTLKGAPVNQAGCAPGYHSVISVLPTRNGRVIRYADGLLPDARADAVLIRKKLTGRLEAALNEDYVDDIRQQLLALIGLTEVSAQGYNAGAAAFAAQEG